MPNYFGNFTYSNGTSTEGIFAYPATSGVATNNPGVNARWMMAFHYNEYNSTGTQCRLEWIFYNE